MKQIFITRMYDTDCLDDLSIGGQATGPGETMQWEIKSKTVNDDCLTITIGEKDDWRSFCNIHNTGNEDIDYSFGEAEKRAEIILAAPSLLAEVTRLREENERLRKAKDALQLYFTLRHIAESPEHFDFLLDEEKWAKKSKEILNNY